jgi:hypothetical protein
MPSAITPIATITTTTAVNTIVFSSISQAYRDLLIVVRGSVTSPSTNYLGISLPAGLWHRTQLLNSSSIQGSGTNTANLYGQGTNSFGNQVYELTVYDYSTTDKFKSFTMMDGTNQSSTAAPFSLQVGSHDRTNALTSFTVSAAGTTLVAGMTVSVYGVSL